MSVVAVVLIAFLALLVVAVASMIFRAWRKPSGSSPGSWREDDPELRRIDARQAELYANACEWDETRPDIARDGFCSARLLDTERQRHLAASDQEWGGPWMIALEIILIIVGFSVFFIAKVF